MTRDCNCNCTMRIIQPLYKKTSSELVWLAPSEQEGRKEARRGRRRRKSHRAETQSCITPSPKVLPPAGLHGRKYTAFYAVPHSHLRCSIPFSNHDDWPPRYIFYATAVAGELVLTLLVSASRQQWLVHMGSLVSLLSNRQLSRPKTAVTTLVGLALLKCTHGPW